MQLPGPRTACAAATVVALVAFLAAPVGGVVVEARTPAGAIPGAHECVPRSKSARGAAGIPWVDLRNPIFATDHMTKDQAIRLVEGRWHLFYSERIGPQIPNIKGVGHATSTDLREWDVASLQFPERGSPDITRDSDGQYVLTFQQNDPSGSEVNQLVYQTATDPNGEWSPPAQLVEGEFSDERIIDAALAHTKNGLFLIFKRGLHDQVVQPISVAHSPSGSPDGPWKVLGEPDLSFAENFQFLVIGGVWHLLTTKIPVHIPTLYRLVGDPSVPSSWLHWKKVRELHVPQEAWNEGRTPGIDHETANSAFLCDARRLDGHWYLFYAGSSELETFEGRGHAMIGIARSKDLKRWEVPPG